MADCDCMFLVRLVAGFQDNTYLYMVLEAAMGGEFFLYMQVRVSQYTCTPFRPLPLHACLHHAAHAFIVVQQTSSPSLQSELSHPSAPMCCLHWHVSCMTC